MLKAIKNFLNNFGFGFSNAKDGLSFQIIGDVLIVHIPRCRLPPSRFEDYAKRQLDVLEGLKEEFGVSRILVLPKGE